MLTITITIDPLALATERNLHDEVQRILSRVVADWPAIRDARGGVVVSTHGHPAAVVRVVEP